MEKVSHTNKLANIGGQARLPAPMMLQGIGGQAVIEGVMMRGKNNWVVAVRKPDKSIIVEKRKINSLIERFSFLRYPLFRGILVLIESLKIGIQALSFSAQESSDEDIKITSGELTISVIIAFVIGIGLFILLPAWLSGYIHKFLGNLFVANLIEGFLRIGIFIGYLFFISRFSDIRRVFEYHGAEHKVINAYERGKELTPEIVSGFSPLHLRCGTSFILVALVVLILIYSFFGKMTILMRILSRLILLPLVVGLTYEIIKVAGRYPDNYFVRMLMAPGLLVQRMTTREPSLDELEVAIAAVKSLLEIEKQGEAVC